MTGAQAETERPGRPVVCALDARGRANYRWQLRWSVALAVTDGIMANAPIMALKVLGAAPWQLGIRLTLSSVGMFASLWLGWVMARRAKKPFVIVPGLGYAASLVGMLLTANPLVFLCLLGGASVFELVTRPAVTAVIRECYPAERRNVLMGRIRAWSSLAFLLSILASALLLQYPLGGEPLPVIHGLLGAGALGVVISLFMFAGIRPPTASRTGDGDESPPPDLHHGTATLQPNTYDDPHPWRTIRQDRRLHRYLLGCFLFGFGGLIYVSYIPALLTRELGYGFLLTALLLHVLPASVQCLAVVPMGHWFDRVSVWRAWSVARLGWGLDPLILMGAVFFPGIALPFTMLGRVFRGAAMGGSAVLWWQTGIHQFAPPGTDTSRYMAVQTVLNGVLRLVAPFVGMLMLAYGSFTLALGVGGLIVLLSALHAHYQARRERSRPELATTATYERSFFAPRSELAATPCTPGVQDQPTTHHETQPASPTSTPTPASR